MKKIIVKRHENLERFDERKIYASCYSACINCSINKLKAEKICEKASREIKLWIKNKKQVTSDDLFNKLSKILNKFDRDASFMYKTHRDVN